MDYNDQIWTSRRKKRRNWLPLLAVLFLLTSVSYLVIKSINIKRPPIKIVSPLAIFAPKKDNKLLANTIQDSLKGTTGSYGIFVKNLKTEEAYEFNANKTFDSASLYKLWVMNVVYQQIQEGNLQKNQELSEEVSVLNEKFKIATESAELKEGKITLPVESALTRMITISDNYSALLLAWKMRLSKVALFLKENEFNSSTVGTSGSDPASTASDIALFLEKLYKGELANEQNTKEMIDLLKKQRLNSKLPKYLPKETVIAHKTGELGLFTHDAGIVYTPAGDYIIVVLSESNDPRGAVERIAQISKNVYNYFSSQ